MNVIPGQNPADGPNYFNFGDDVVYRINVDNDRDGKAEDVIYELRFKTRNRPVGGRGGLTSPVPYLGNPHIPNAVPLQGITRLDGPGSEGLTRRQTYSVTEIRGSRHTELFSGQTLVAVPSNIGTATMPNYEASRPRASTPAGARTAPRMRSSPGSARKRSTSTSARCSTR
jgi:hypothetical protein